MNEQMPFAVVGSREEIVVNNVKVRAREYAWGVVEVENEAHCDFVKLREMLIRTNMEDLRERTHTVSHLCVSWIFQPHSILSLGALRAVQTGTATADGKQRYSRAYQRECEGYV